MGGLTDVRSRLTLPQINALRAVIPEIPHATVIQVPGLVQTVRGYQKVVRLEAVDDGFFELACLDPSYLGSVSQRAADGKFGAVVTEKLRVEMEDGTPLERLSGPSFPVVATLDKFAGITPRAYGESGTEGWIHLDASMPLSVTGTLIVKLPPDIEAGSLEARLAPALENHRNIFDEGVGFIAAPAGMTPAQVQIYKYSAWAVRGFGWILLLLTLVSVACHQYGRIEQTTSLARIMTAVGAPPGQIWTLAAAEPLLMAVSALFGGYFIAWATLQILPGTRGWELGYGLPWEIAILLLVPICALIVMRARLLSASAAPTVGRGWRILHRVLPVLLFIQVALASLATGLAAQTALQSMRNRPPDPLFPLAGLTYLTARQEQYRAPPQRHLAERWGALWHTDPVDGVQVALASRGAPFLGEPPHQTMWVNGKKVLFRDVGVSANFFQVLGVSDPPLIGAESFVLNRVLGDFLQRSGPEVANVRIVGPEGDQVVKPTSVVDDGVIGNPYATYDFTVTSELDASNQLAAPPTAYHLFTEEFDPRSPLTLVVRHDPGLSSEQVADMLLPHLRRLLPSAAWEKIAPARDMLAPDGNEGAAIIGLLIGIATLSVGGFGLIALLAMFMRSMRTEILIAGVCGITAERSLWLISRRCSAPYLFGMTVGLLPVGVLVLMQASNFARVNTTISWFGPLLAIGILLSILGLAILTGAKSFRRHGFFTQLRHE